MARREFSRKVKREALKRANGHCEKCKAVLKIREGEVDHILPDVLGGEPVIANAQVLCRICHAEKTADDIRRTRRADRQRDKHSGAMRNKPKMISQGFRTGRKQPLIDNSSLPPLPKPQVYRQVSE